MQTTITARHCEVPDTLRKAAEQVVDRVARVARRPHRAQVVFDAEHNRKIVELHVSLPRGQVCVASAEATNFRTALDRAAARLRQQMQKLAGRTDRVGRSRPKVTR
ncbi:MAG: ribosome-associated translation inhibitor RaiA [Gemmatimonadetes bacterium]|jgi:ribosomal subunit interface protein|nr:ribosome-associated translation inhibitor RaiA [Gemmatimonadota bacterium]